MDASTYTGERKDGQKMHVAFNPITIVVAWLVLSSWEKRVIFLCS